MLLLSTESGKNRLKIHYINSTIIIIKKFRLNAKLLDAAVARCQAQANQEVEDKAGTTHSHPSSFLCVFRVLQ